MIGFQHLPEINRTIRSLQPAGVFKIFALILGRNQLNQLLHMQLFEVKILPKADKEASSTGVHSHLLVNLYY